MGSGAIACTVRVEAKYAARPSPKCKKSLSNDVVMLSTRDVVALPTRAYKKHTRCCEATYFEADCNGRMLTHTDQLHDAEQSCRKPSLPEHSLRHTGYCLLQLVHACNLCVDVGNSLCMLRDMSHNSLKDVVASCRATLAKEIVDTVGTHVEQNLVAGSLAAGFETAGCWAAGAHSSGACGACINGCTNGEDLDAEKRYWMCARGPTIRCTDWRSKGVLNNFTYSACLVCKRCPKCRPIKTHFKKKPCHSDVVDAKATSQILPSVF